MTVKPKWNGSAWVNEDSEVIKAEKEKQKKIADNQKELEKIQKELDELNKTPQDIKTEELTKRIKKAEDALAELKAQGS